MRRNSKRCIEPRQYIGAALSDWKGHWSFSGLQWVVLLSSACKLPAHEGSLFEISLSEPTVCVDVSNRALIHAAASVYELLKHNCEAACCRLALFLNKHQLPQSPLRITSDIVRGFKSDVGAKVTQ
jgi:hypothetical protein